MRVDLSGAAGRVQRRWGSVERGRRLKGEDALNERNPNARAGRDITESYVS